MILRDGKTGEGYQVEDIRLEEKVKRRLQILGLTQGTRVEILNQKKSGTLIIKVRGTRFAVGRQIAEGVQVNAGQDEGRSVR